MSSNHPQLIFVSGPQAGQSIVLQRSSAVLGRGSGADILFSEEFVSRQHARYELLAEGPTLENLSAKGTMINGKRYKQGKKILLATGDVIGVGHRSEMLFVSAGDDVDAAVAALQAAPTRRNAFGEIVPTVQAPAVHPPLPLQAPQPEPEIAPEQARVVEKKPSEMSEGEREILGAKAKRKRLIVGMAAWWGLLAVGVILMLVFRGDKNPSSDVTPLILGQKAGADQMPGQTETLRAIKAMLKEPLTGLSANPTQRDKRLTVGMQGLEKGGNNLRSRLETLLAFKEALAYQGRSYFGDFRNERYDLKGTELDARYNELVDVVTEQIGARYINGVLLERAGNWAPASAEFRTLLEDFAGLAMLDHVDQSKSLAANFSQHARYIQSRMALPAGPRGPMGM